MTWVSKQGRYQRRIIYIDGKKMYYARYIMEQRLGRKLSSNEVVHHLDGDTLNDEISNLVVTSPMNHCANHNSARICTQETKAKMSAMRKGRFINTEWRKKMGDARRGEKNHAYKYVDMKTVCEYLDHGMTRKKIAALLGVCKNTLYNKIVAQGESL